MKKITLILMLLIFTGCASLTYQPDGTVKYFRFCTGSDVIKGEIKDKASIEVRKQQGLDVETLKAILNVLGSVK